MVMGALAFHKPVAATSLFAVARWATIKAVRFAIDPPLVSMPVAPGAYPISAASQRTTIRSISVAAGPERQDGTFELSAEAIKSAKAPGAVAGEATYPKN